MHDLARNNASGLSKCDSSRLMDTNDVENNKIVFKMKKESQVTNQNRPQSLSLSELALQDLSSPFNQGSGPWEGTTPTPTQFLFPKKVTAEQEEFTKGFDKALQEIYQRKAVSVHDKTVESLARNDQSNSSWSDSTLSQNSRNSSPYSGSSGLTDQPLSESLNASSESLKLERQLHASVINGRAPSSIGYVSVKCEPSLPLLSSSNSQHLNYSHPNAFTCNNPLPMKTVYNLDTRSVELTDISSSFQPMTSSLSSIQGSSARVQNLPYGRPRLQGTQSNSSYRHPIMSAGMGGPTAMPLRVATAGGMVRQPRAATAAHLPSALEKHQLDTFPPTIKMEEGFDLDLKYARTNSMDPEEQERLKLERKRAKNRLAAQRCQARKIEKISRLEDKVCKLREQNLSLSQTVSALNKNISDLRQQITFHRDRGCRLMFPSLHVSQLP